MFEYASDAVNQHSMQLANMDDDVDNKDFTPAGYKHKGLLQMQYQYRVRRLNSNR